MNGRRAKIIKRKGEQRTELRQYRDLKNCRKQMNVGTLLAPIMVPQNKHGTLVLRDEVRAVNKQLKRYYTRNGVAV